MNEKIEKIKQLAKIEEYARYIGFHPIKKSGRYTTLEEHDSVMINTQTNRFFRNSSSDTYASGSVINFAMYFEELEYTDAVKRLEEFLGSDYLDNAVITKPLVSNPKRKKMLQLPEKAKNKRNAYAYLNRSRMIDKIFIDYMFESNHLYQDINNNCVFVSYDEHSQKPNFACKRGTNTYKTYKGDVEGCDYDYCFTLPQPLSDTLYVTESVIDMLSIMTLKLLDGEDIKKIANNHYQCLSGTQKYPAIFNYLTVHPEIKNVYLAFDNDESGRKTVATILHEKENKKLTINFYSMLPSKDNYDWNEILKERTEQK